MEASTQPENYAAPKPDELLKHLPTRVRERFAHFLATGDAAAADEGEGSEGVDAGPAAADADGTSEA